jgi:hypothetical protein
MGNGKKSAIEIIYNLKLVHGGPDEARSMFLRDTLLVFIRFLQRIVFKQRRKQPSVSFANFFLRQ